MSQKFFNLLCLGVCILALVLSIVNSFSLSRANSRIDLLTKQFSDQNSLIVKQNKDIHSSLRAIDAHLQLLDKWASKERAFFYGDSDVDIYNSNVKVKSK